MQPCHLAAHDLACLRGERLLFRRFNLVLNAGDACHITGANGTGKSSLIRILAGLAHPFAGTIECRGGRGLLDERPALDPHQTLADAMGFWHRLDQPADSKLARIGLGELLDVPVRFLSTGQKKRAGLARLIGQQAPIWLLDEPLNGLDHQATNLVAELIAEHCASGGIALVASHQPITLPGTMRINLEDFIP